MSTARPLLHWQSLDLNVSSALPPEMDAQLRGFWQTGAGATCREVSLMLGPLPPPRDAVVQTVSLMERPLEIRVAVDEVWLGDQLWARTGPLGAEVRCLPQGAPPRFAARTAGRSCGPAVSGWTSTRSRVVSGEVMVIRAARESPHPETGADV